MRLISSAEAIREATAQLFSSSKDYYIMGEGVPDPKCCFGTTKGLKDEFPNQVFDMPISENGGTGVGIGSAIGGMRPIMVHMRIDFLMYAMDQIVNNAAKWYSMFGGQAGCVPLVIRAFIGRGWGQGMQHSQNLEAMFAHVPGLKVVTPSNPYNAKGLLIAAARDNNPVIMIEHRWVHSLIGPVPEDMYEVELGKARVAREGKDLTIVTWGYQVAESLKAAQFLAFQGVEVEVLDMQSLSPMDYEAIKRSVDKTGRMLVVDEAWGKGCLGEHILSTFHMSFKNASALICNPNYPPASSHALTKDYYPDPNKIMVVASLMLEKELDFSAVEEYMKARAHDVPDENFKGPF